ncbi:MAG: hypothetical protein MJ252_22105 [archaeon]|nr:hypothetical protein [archaeon]
MPLLTLQTIFNFSFNIFTFLKEFPLISKDVIFSKAKSSLGKTVNLVLLKFKSVIFGFSFTIFDNFERSAERSLLNLI